MERVPLGARSATSKNAFSLPAVYPSAVGVAERTDRFLAAGVVVGEVVVFVRPPFVGIRVAYSHSIGDAAQVCRLSFTLMVHITVLTFWLSCISPARSSLIRRSK